MWVQPADRILPYGSGDAICSNGSKTAVQYIDQSERLVSPGLLLPSFILLVCRDLLFGGERSGFCGRDVSLSPCGKCPRTVLNVSSPPFLISFISHERIPAGWQNK